MLLITSEFDQWEIRDHKVPDRLDVLFLDTEANDALIDDEQKLLKSLSHPALPGVRSSTWHRSF